MEKNEQFDRIDSEEWILSRIHKSNYHPDRELIIDIPAFRPTGEDCDGISMYRELCITAYDLVKNARKPQNEYIVVRFRVGDLLKLGLSLQATEDEDGLPGHVVIPELSTSKYESNRKYCKEIHKKLAELARLNVVDFP